MAETVFRNANLVKVTLPSDITELPTAVLRRVFRSRNRSSRCVEKCVLTRRTERRTVCGRFAASGKSGVFNNCESLETINLGDTALEYVHEGMFSYCSKLKSVTLPATVRGVGAYAFEGCPVEAYALSGESEFLSVEEGVLYDKGKTLLLTRKAERSKPLPCRQALRRLQSAHLPTVCSKR
ncbi:MAG: leucine-rich repeat protein [Christensenellales bacterium]